MEVTHGSFAQEEQQTVLNIFGFFGGFFSPQVSFWIDIVMVLNNVCLFTRFCFRLEYFDEAVRDPASQTAVPVDIHQPPAFLHKILQLSAVQLFYDSTGTEQVKDFTLLLIDILSLNPFLCPPLFFLLCLLISHWLAGSWEIKQVKSKRGILKITNINTSFGSTAWSVQEGLIWKNSSLWTFCSLKFILCINHWQMIYYCKERKCAIMPPTVMTVQTWSRMKTGKKWYPT